MENSRKWLENLNDDDLLFIKQIVLHSGSLKEVANYYGVIYPTLRNKLNSLIQKIEFFESVENAKDDPYIDHIKVLVNEKKLSMSVATNLIVEYHSLNKK